MAIKNPIERAEHAGGNTPGEPRASGTTHHIRLFLISRMARVINPFLLGHAGNRRLMMVAVIHHRGRRSGRAYATPTSARPTPDGFVIPMTFGEQADWFRNIQAAGGCVIEWRGAEHTMVEPEVVDLAAIRSAFSPLERALMPLIGVKQFVRLRHAPISSAEPI